MSKFAIDMNNPSTTNTGAEINAIANGIKSLEPIENDQAAVKRVLAYLTAKFVKKHTVNR